MFDTTALFSHTHRSASRGVSLLVVMLVGSVLVLAATSLAGVAKRVLQSSASYQESLQSSYGAEDVFGCVEWWLQHGSDGPNSFEEGESVTCLGKSYTFNTSGNKEVGLYEKDSNVSTSTFTVKTVNGGIVEVEVVRNLADTTIFDGKVILHAFNVGDTSPRNAERLRVYTVKQSPFTGADIVFLIDRSGSIEGNRVAPSLGDSWGKLLTAVGKAVYLIADELPSPQVSYVTFGTETTDTGKAATGCAPPITPAECGTFRKPDVSLTSAETNTVVGTLIDPFDVYHIPKDIETTPSETNLSLGLAIAGAELMGKLYPSKDAPTAYKGMFEEIVADWGDPGNVPNVGQDLTLFGDLPDQSTVRDRPDNEFPDFIVLITDGQPNGLVRHLPDPVTCIMPLTGVQRTTGVGDSIFFASPSVPVGKSCTITSQPQTTDYYFCNDRGLSDPTYTPSNFDFLDGGNTGVNPSKCNAYITAEALKRNGITIIVIGVGAVGDIDEAFLSDKIASKNDDGTSRYFRVENFTDLQDLFDEFTSKVIPTVLR